MLHEDDAVRLRHMRDAGSEALEYAALRQRGDLDSDRQLVHSPVRCVEIIGEAASRMSPELSNAHPEIPWGAIVGMRNRLIHAYFDVNLSILWRTVSDELPSLVRSVESILEAGQ